MSKPVTKAVLTQVLTAHVAKHWKSSGPTWYAAHRRKIKGPDSTAHSRRDGLNTNVVLGTNLNAVRTQYIRLVDSKCF